MTTETQSTEENVTTIQKRGIVDWVFSKTGSIVVISVLMALFVFYAIVSSNPIGLIGGFVSTMVVLAVINHIQKRKAAKTEVSV